MNSVKDKTRLAEKQNKKIEKNKRNIIIKYRRESNMNQIK